MTCNVYIINIILTYEYTDICLVITNHVIDIIGHGVPLYCLKLRILM